MAKALRARTIPSDMYDTKLVTAAQQGDEAAFAALYDRNADGIYDLCFALVGDEAEAARLTAMVFTLAARYLSDISDSSQVRPWLLAIARDRVLAEDEAGTLRSAWGAEPAAPSVASIEPLGTNELRRWAREAAATLALADQVVVELCTRHDLDGDQLAAAIGCGPARLDSVVSQVEQEAEQVLGSLVLARQGRRDCKRLAGVLSAWDGRPTVEIADVVDRHAATCERCRRRRALVSPLELLTAAPSATPPPGLRVQALECAVPELPSGVVSGAVVLPADPVEGAGAAITAGPGPGAAVAGAAVAGAVGAVAAGAMPADTVRAGPDATTVLPVGAVAAGGFVDDPVARPPLRTERPWGLIAAVVGAILVLVLALVLVLRSPSSTKVAAHPTTPTSQAVAPGTTTVTTLAAVPATIPPIATSTIASTLPAAAGSQLTLNTTNVDFGTDATSAQVVLADTGAGQAGWHATSPASWLTISPPAGFLQPSGQVQVTFVLDRQKAPTGPFALRVVFVPSDAHGTSASLGIVGTNTMPTTTTSPSTTTTAALSGAPVITGVSASPASIQTSPCPSDQSVVSATVTDPAGVATVVVEYTLPGGAPGSATMTQSGSKWSGAISASASTGRITYSVQATGVDGRTATSATHTIAVGACPI